MRLSPGGEAVVEGTFNTPRDGCASGGFADKYGAGNDDGCDFGVRSGLREAESGHLVNLFQKDFEDACQLVASVF